MNRHLRPFHCAALAATLLLCACGGGGGGGGDSSSSSTGSTGGSTTTTGTVIGTVATPVAGYNVSAVLKPFVSSAAAAYIWGENLWGQIGDGTLSTPKASAQYVVSSATTWRAIAAGGNHTVGVKSDGTLWAWGLSVNGQVGDGTFGASNYKASPVKIGTAATWRSVSAGENHTMALNSAPALYIWGQNSSGQLGNGTTADAAAPPSAAIATAGSTWRAIAAGAQHSMGLRADGVVWTWGDDTYGQLGDWAPGAAKLTPSAVVGLTGSVTAIAAGHNHSLAIKTDGTLWAWGDGTYGQLGYAPAAGTASAIPGQVPGTNWVAVAGGGGHTLAVKVDQTLWAWGDNTYGQLGDNSTTNTTAPVQIASGTRWVAVAAGKYHSLAVDSNGKLWTWGRNAEGQLGTGTAGSPVLVPTMLP